MQINISQNEFQRLKTFKQYNSVEEMNDHVNAHLPNISAGERRFLTLISQYSCFETHTGCCWRKRSQLSKELEVSPRTITNYISSLKKKNVIKVVETFCNKKKGANIFIILPSSEVNEVKNASPKVTRSSSFIKAETKAVKAIRKEEPQIDQLDESYVPNHIPKEFVNATKPYFGSHEIFKLWGKVLLAATKTGTHDILSMLETIISTFKGCVFYKKSNRIKKDFVGYVYSAFYRVMIEQKRRNANNLPSWLGGIAQ